MRQSCDYLAVIAHRDQYYPVTEVNSSHFCAQSHPIDHREVNENKCKIDLLNDVARPESCQMELAMTNSAWIEILTTNKWIYAVAKESRLVCYNSNVIRSIKGLGILALEPGYIVKREHTTV